MAVGSGFLFRETTTGVRSDRLDRHDGSFAAQRSISEDMGKDIDTRCPPSFDPKQWPFSGALLHPEGFGVVGEALPWALWPSSAWAAFWKGGERVRTQWLVEN